MGVLALLLGSLSGLAAVITAVAKLVWSIRRQP